jgi:hypothetical protein
VKTGAAARDLRLDESRLEIVEGVDEIRVAEGLDLWPLVEELLEEFCSLLGIDRSSHASFRNERVVDVLNVREGLIGFTGVLGSSAMNCELGRRGDRRRSSSTPGDSCAEDEDALVDSMIGSSVDMALPFPTE